jgi:hypothetical protein
MHSAATGSEGPRELVIPIARTLGTKESHEDRDDPGGADRGQPDGP